MAQKQVGARTEGDVYQGLFFWKQAASLLIPGSKVQQVDLEHDDVTGMDDVAVFYEHPGICADGWMCNADFYQIKYHVDRRTAYSCEAFVDPSFIQARSSLLQRAYTAFTRARSVHERFRLNFVSNWGWTSEDPLGKVLREYDGRLPERFFTSGNRSHLGKIRESWRSHLSLDENEFRLFGNTLRFQLDHFGRRDFRDSAYDRLARVGLSVPESDTIASPYESLVQQFLMNGPNSFHRDSILDLCQREGLLSDNKPCERIPTIGLRSFIRFAEHLEEETDEFVCVSEEFEGRHPRNVNSWSNAARVVQDFFANAPRRLRLRAGEYAIALECHGSLAMLAGYEVSRNSGCLIFPIQKPRRELWKPDQDIVGNLAGSWEENAIAIADGAQDIALTLSVTHDISGDVQLFFEQEAAPRVSHIINLKPSTGIGPQSVVGPNHACQLAFALVSTLRRVRSMPSACVHLFASAPNSLLFLLGQFREALGRLKLYEYDFGFERHCSYEPSITLPTVENFQ